MRTFAVWLFGAALPIYALGGASKELPSWVQEASSAQLPSYPGEVPAVVLLDERHVTVDPSGAFTIESRRAVKVLTREGAKEADAAEFYSRNGRKVNRFGAWLIAPSGFTKSYDKNAVEDLGLFETMELYDDLRVRRIHAENAEIGSVFAYESEVQQPPLFAQDEYEFQDNLPSLRSRYIVTLPAGWSAKGVVLGHEPIQPAIDGSRYVWEIKNLSFHKTEQFGPEWSGLAPRLAVNFIPPETAPTNSFQSWADVSRWHTTLSAGTDELSPEIVEKVKQLTANASTELDKIRAISRYVQDLKYVAIEMDLERGDGYKPHLAATVLHHEYGDCKDKANLMHTMLKAAGIESYLVAIYSGDRTYVHEEWPSPKQFNHMIVAIRVPDTLKMPTVLDNPQLGRLLIFDPTSEVTPLGDLPEYEQGSFALLCAGARGEVVRMPSTGPEVNLTEVSLDATLSAQGDLTATVNNMLAGHFADSERYLQTHETPDQYRKILQERLYQSAKGVTLNKVDKNDSFAGNSLNVKMDFASERFGQIMQQRLLVFTPSLSIPSLPHLPADSQRYTPVLLNAGVRRKHVKVKLPSGFSIDEMPQSIEFTSDFGHFFIKYTQTAGELDLDEELKTDGALVPASDYQKVKTFFDHCNGADHQQAVLVKN